MVRIVWVGDENDTYRELSRQGDISVERASTVEEARRASEGADYLVSGYEVNGRTAPELFERVREASPDTHCVLLTDRDESEISLGGDVVFDYVRRGSQREERLTSLLRYSALRRSQVAYPLPEDEQERLNEIERYELDEIDAGRLDKITELVARFFETDIAYVGIVDKNEQDYVSCHGVELSTVDRQDTVCTHAIASVGITVTEDPLNDPRFEGNEAVHDIGARLYAGAPITTSAGATVGTLCLMDGEKRDFGDEDRDSLRKFADVVSESARLVSTGMA